MSALLTIICEQIAAKGEPISFADFMELALYHPEFGYYQRDRKRVGFSGETDFFTASSARAVFGELVSVAAANLLKPDEPTGFTFLEIGAEPEHSVLPEKHPFAESQVFRLGESVLFPEKTVFFSNELFDAQPFHRIVFSDGGWHEIGVDWQKDGLREVLLRKPSDAVQSVSDRLPDSTAEGYHLDLPIAATELLRKLVSNVSWQGSLILFDYGKSWRELIEATPQGTARAYRKHQQSNDLLADPGEQDLTGHICWDWMTEVLVENGFRNISLQSQEAFFVAHAAEAIEKIITEKPGQLDPRRQMLQQLIHPGNMGQKFQVLSARR